VTERDSGNVETNLWLVGIRIDPDDEFPIFYTIITGDGDTPIQIDHRMILFDQIELMPKAASLGGLSETPDKLRSLELELVYDFAAALYLVENAATDESADVINCLNFLCDVVKTTNADMPNSYRKQLSDFAAHLTFSRSLSDYFEKTNDQRSDIINGILWCLGCLLSHARILH